MELVTIERTDGLLDNSAYEKLEAGNILLFPRTPIEFSEGDYRFLTAQRQTRAGYHKNIAYRPATGRLTGVARGTDQESLRRIMQSFSSQAAQVLARAFPRYAEGWRLDYASFRPFEEENRGLSLHARNDLLHFDAFPTRPTFGDRILRFFVNLNAERPRVWIAAEPFAVLASRFAKEAGLLAIARRREPTFAGAVRLLSIKMHLPQIARSPYDAMMHRFHNFLKENSPFQKSCAKQRWEFPPLSSWMVFTDMVSHAVLSGRLALEQTFIISRQAMVRPEWAPVSVLERLAGTPLVRAGQ